MWVHDQGLMYSDGFSLVAMLRASRQFQASNLKDKVCAIYDMVDFGLDSTGRRVQPGSNASNMIPAEIKPNYSPSKSYNDVYFDVTRYLLAKEESLAVLTATQRITASGYEGARGANFRIRVGY